MVIDYTKLVADLKVGLAKAQEAAVGEDAGTCNFDSPMFHFDRSPSPAIMATYERALNEIGLRFSWTGDIFGRGKNRRLVFGPGAGRQASSRTRAPAGESLYSSQRRAKLDGHDRHRARP